MRRLPGVFLSMISPTSQPLDGGWWLTTRTGFYYFESVYSPNVFWVDLKNIDFAEDTGVRMLDLGSNQTQYFLVVRFLVPLSRPSRLRLSLRSNLVSS